MLKILNNVLLIVCLYVLSKGAHAVTIKYNYHECTDLVYKNPANALEYYQKWDKLDSSAPLSRHCKGLALYGLGKTNEAATELEKFATNPQLEVLTRIEALKQASKAWQATGDNSRAADSMGKASVMLIDGGMELRGYDTLVEQAKLLLKADRKMDAIQALDEAVEIKPDGGAEVVREVVYKQLGIVSKSAPKVDANNRKKRVQSKIKKVQEAKKPKTKKKQK